MRRVKDIVELVGDAGWLWKGLSCVFFFFQAEDGIRDLVRSRGLGDVYKRQVEKEAKKRNIDATIHTTVAGALTGVTTGNGIVNGLSLIHI